jgi:hypothetical protein
MFRISAMMRNVFKFAKMYNWWGSSMTVGLGLILPGKFME